MSIRMAICQWYKFAPFDFSESSNKLESQNIMTSSEHVSNMLQK